MTLADPYNLNNRGKFWVLAQGAVCAVTPIVATHYDTSVAQAAIFDTWEAGMAFPERLAEQSAAGVLEPSRSAAGVISVHPARSA